MPKGGKVHKVIWSEEAWEGISVFHDYLVHTQHYTPDYANGLCDRIVESPNHLARFPRLRSEAPAYGKGVRKIVIFGHLVLYEIDDTLEVIRILAVVGQRQAPRKLR